MIGIIVEETPLYYYSKIRNFFSFLFIKLKF